MVGLNSAIFVGNVWHKRFVPSEHEFRYPIFQGFFDLDELDTLTTRFRWFSIDRKNLMSIQQSDYLIGDNSSLRESVVSFAKQYNVEGICRIMMLTQPRIFGLAFNPLTLFYVFSDDAFLGMVAEVHNTPWNERHRYWVPATSEQPHHYQHDKTFHVSPFNPMSLKYFWTFDEPGTEAHVTIDTRRQAETEEHHFIASFSLKREPIEKLQTLLIRFPLAAVSNVTRIYYQAAKLWLKKVPFFSHPSSASDTKNVG